MMKTNLRIWAVMVLSVVCMSSCNDNRTYAEMKKDQEKAIGKLIADKGFEILRDYPKDSIFGENQFVKLENGIYLNVVNAGNGNKPVIAKTTVLIRFKVIDFANQSEEIAYDYFDNDKIPLEFLYGNASYTVSINSQNYYSDYYNFFGAGIENILPYVGEDAIVKAIIPFEEGSTMQSTLGTPLYFEKLKFMYY